jgi:hypothetical protein
VTGKPVEGWAGSDKGAKSGGSSSDFSSSNSTVEKAAESEASGSCHAAVADLRRGRGGAGEGDEDGFAPLAPWGVQLAGNFSKAIALASFERARQRYAGVIGDIRPMIIGRVLRSRGTRKFYQVRLPAATRQAAQTICGRIRAAGGICLALPS